MLHAADSFAPVEDIGAFLDLMVFGVTRQLVACWYAARRDGEAPPLAAVEPQWWRLGHEYVYRWTLTPDGADLVCTGCGPRLADYMQRDLRGLRFGEHAPGPTGAQMLSNHLDCLRRGTPFAVIREHHPFPERGSGYEALIVPVDAGGEGADTLLGHLMPFAPAGIARRLARPGLLVDAGHRLRL